MALAPGNNSIISSLGRFSVVVIVACKLNISPSWLIVLLSFQTCPNGEKVWIGPGMCPNNAHPLCTRF